MKNIKFLPYVILLTSIGISIFLWDYLKLPYDQNNIIQGTSFNKKLNPYNNIFKVLFFILFPLIFFLISYLYLNKLKSINPIKKNFFLKNCYQSFSLDQNIIAKINYLTFFLITFTIIEFLSLNFKILLSPIDIYHDGLVLVPTLNYLIFESLWQTTHYDWGMGANLRPIIIWKILGVETLGSIRFFDQSLILFNKFMLIFISRKVSLILAQNNLTTIFYFIFLSFSSLYLSDYFVSLNGTAGPPFPLRLFPFLVFFYYLIDDVKKKSFYPNNLIVGLFSSLSFLWYTDVALYTNLILIIYLLIMIIIREYKRVVITIFGVTISWILFIFIFGFDQLNEMFSQINSNMEFIYYFNFLEFPKPLSDHYASSRGLKSLLLIIFNSVACIHLCLKENKLSLGGKITLILTLLTSVIIFKSAIVRADSYHIKYSSGFIFYLFLINIYLLFLNNKIVYERFSNFINYKNNFFLPVLLVLLTATYFISNKIDLRKIYKNINEDIINVLYTKNDYFLNFKAEMWNYGRKYSDKNFDEDKKFIKYFRNLTKNDNCVQNFTEYLSISFYLNKPTCTKFYNPQFIQHNITDKKFLEEFSKNLPEYILYSSPIKFLDKYGNIQQQKLILGIPDVDKFLKKNYIFYETYADKWTILKKK